MHKAALVSKFRGEEVAGCVTATIEGKRVVLGRDGEDGVFRLTSVGEYYAQIANTAPVPPVEAVKPKVKRGLVQRPKLILGDLEL
jgi:hypothetical protein